MIFFANPISAGEPEINENFFGKGKRPWDCGIGK
jgi:hypothetical protein